MVHLTIAAAGTPVTVPVNTLLFRNEKGMQVGVVVESEWRSIRLGVIVTVGRDFGNSVEIIRMARRRRTRWWS